MKRHLPTASAVLLPLLAATAAFWVARDGPAVAAFFAESTEPPAKPFREPDAGAKLTAVRHDLHGLARRRELAALLSTPSISVAERLRASGLGDGFYSAEVVSEMARHDPEGAWHLMLEQGRISKEVLQEWLRQEPQAIVTAIASVPSPQLRAELNHTLIDLLLHGDPAVASVIASNLSLLDPSSAAGGNLELANRLRILPPSASRDALLESIAGSAGANWLEVSHWATTLPPDLRTKIETRLAQRALTTEETSGPFLAWAQQWLSRDAPPDVQTRLGADYIRSLAATNPDAAMTWAGTHLSGFPLAEATGQVVAARFATDPDAAFELVSALPPGGVQSLAATRIAEQWFKIDPTATLLWWNDFPHTREGPSQFLTLSSEWALSQPQQFRQFLDDPSTPALPLTVITGGIGELFHNDPGGTIDWLASLQGDNRDPALNWAFSAWAVNDPEAAAARLSYQPDLLTTEDTRTVAKYFYLQGSDHAPAVNWVASLPEGAIRDSTAATVREWISGESGMTTAQKQSLLSKLP